MGGCACEGQNDLMGIENAIPYIAGVAGRAVQYQLLYERYLVESESKHILDRMLAHERRLR